MRRKTLLSISLLVTLAVGIPSLRSNPDGTPSDGRTGSPGDGGKTCSQGGCHGGSATTVTNFITSNIPAEGYTPGASYTITVSVDGAGKKGLCVSPQKDDGTVIGTLTAGTGNQMVGKGYITHTTPKTTIPAVWTFTWVAPAKGTGAFNFYGCFANNTTQVRKTQLAVSETVATGVSENAAISKLSLYPNPAVSEELNIGFEVKRAGNFKVSLIDITGKEVASFVNGYLNAGSFEEKFQLPTLGRGIYFLQIETGLDVLNRKLLIQQN